MASCRSGAAVAHCRSVLQIPVNGRTMRARSANLCLLHREIRMSSVRCFALAAALTLAGTGAHAQSARVAQSGKSVLDDVLAGLDAKRDVYAGVAQQIWGFAEV